MNNRLARWHYLTTFEFYNPDSATIDLILLCVILIVSWSIL